MRLQSSINTWFMVITEEFCLGIHDAQQTWSTWVNWCTQVLGVTFLAWEFYLLCKMFHYNEGFPSSHSSQLDRTFQSCVLLDGYTSVYLLLCPDQQKMESKTKSALKWIPEPLWSLLQWPAETIPLEWFKQPILTEWHELGK